MTDPSSDAASEAELELTELFERMGELTAELERAESPERDTAFELFDYLEVWHRTGLERLADALPDDVLAQVREDPVVAHLLDTYLADIDGDPAELVEEALEDIRPYVHSHGGEMELAEIDGGVVKLRLLGACDGCPSSVMTLTQGVEEALRARWTGFERLEVDGDAPAAAKAQPLLQIQSLRTRPES